MKKRPILFSGEMVRAILAGRKSQTRRLVRQQKLDWACVHPDGARTGWIAAAPAPVSAAWVRRAYPGAEGFPCPYGVPGDRLWVRETWLELDKDHWAEPSQPRDLLLERGAPRRNAGAYRADTDAEGDRIRGEYGYLWRPSIHMPRWASRVTLEVTEVRVQRLQEIGPRDIEAEGVVNPGSLNDGVVAEYRHAFARSWDAIYGKRAPWSSNPFVWCISFRRVDAS